MSQPETSTRESWLAERKELLAAEKRHLHEGDELAQRRRRLPWVPVEQEYVFETDTGSKTLAELFDGRSQLLVYHFMFGVGFRLTEQRQGCTGCSFVADHFDGVVPHLNGHDVTLVCASLAPLADLDDYKRQMGWHFTWVSSHGSDFNHDFGVAFTEDEREHGAEYNYRRVEHPEPQREGMSAFALRDGVVHHTYSTYARGVENLIGTYQFLDLAPAGRNEDGLDYAQAWWRRHDEYGTE